MLLQLAVENHGRIADKVVLSLLAVPEEEHPPGQVVEVPGVGQVLRTVVLYGPNGSGKSHLVDAFAQVCELATTGVAPGSTLPVRPHKLSPGWTERPTTFELELALDGVRWSYGLSVSRTRVEAEWLLRDDVMVFEREAEDDGPRIEVGEGLALSEHRRAFYGFVAEGTRSEQPFLAELWSRSAVELEVLSRWLASSQVLTTDQQAREAVFFLLRTPAARAAGSYLLRELDTGIQSVTLVAESLAVQRRIDEGDAFPVAAAFGLATDGAVRVAFMHRTASGVDVPLGFHELSDGTRRLFDLSLTTIPGTSPHTCMIDEIDRSLHSALVIRLVSLLHAQEQRAQLVLTTHDTNLLDAGVLGRDAIWFIDVDEGGAAHLYSLAEFDRDQLDALAGNLERGYLQGRFGAIPFAGDPARLGWLAG